MQPNDAGQAAEHLALTTFHQGHDVCATGGGFGAKIGVYPEESLLGMMSKKLGRPLRWRETRSESMLGMGHGRAQIQYVTIGGTREGSLVVIVGGAGTHKSTLAAMIAAGSEQHGSEPCYRSTEENRWFALERSVRQGFICPSYESYTGTVREHVDSFAASPCNIMLLDGMARMRYVALQEAMIDAKTAAVLHKSTVFVTLHQNNDGRLPGGFMTCADVVIMTASADRSVIVAVRKHSYGTTDSAVMFTIVDGGRLVWDRTSAIASRRSFE